MEQLKEYLENLSNEDRISLHQITIDIVEYTEILTKDTYNEEEFDGMLYQIGNILEVIDDKHEFDVAVLATLYELINDLSDEE